MEWCLSFFMGFVALAMTIGGQSDEWDADDGSAYGTSHDPSRATTAHRSAYDSAAPGDEEEQGKGKENVAAHALSLWRERSGRKGPHCPSVSRNS